MGVVRHTLLDRARLGAGGRSSYAPLGRACQARAEAEAVLNQTHILPRFRGCHFLLGRPLCGPSRFRVVRVDVPAGFAGL